MKWLPVVLAVLLAFVYYRYHEERQVPPEAPPVAAPASGPGTPASSESTAPQPFPASEVPPAPVAAPPAVEPPPSVPAVAMVPSSPSGRLLPVATAERERARAQCKAMPDLPGILDALLRQGVADHGREAEELTATYVCDALFAGSPAPCAALDPFTPGQGPNQELRRADQCRAEYSDLRLMDFASRRVSAAVVEDFCRSAPFERDFYKAGAEPKVCRLLYSIYRKRGVGNECRELSPLLSSEDAARGFEDVCVAHFSFLESKSACRVLKDPSTRGNCERQHGTMEALRGRDPALCGDSAACLVLLRPAQNVCSGARTRVIGKYCDTEVNLTYRRELELEKVFRKENKLPAYKEGAPFLHKAPQ